MFLDSSKNYNFRISADEVLFLFELFNQKRDTIEKKRKRRERRRCRRARLNNKMVGEGDW